MIGNVSISVLWGHFYVEAVFLDLYVLNKSFFWI